MTTRKYRTAGVIGVGAFVMALIALHILDSDLSIAEEYLSVYALSDYGWLSRAANVAMGLGVIAVALGLRATLTEGKRVAASWILIPDHRCRLHHLRNQETALDAARSRSA